MKMDKVKVNIGDKTYICKVADTEETRTKGLLDIDNLPIDEGMLFVWDDEGTREMWMKDTKIPLDLIAINSDDEVILVYQALPENETLVPFPNAKYILEVNLNSGIEEGDDFEIDDSDDLDKYVMKVLAPDGSTLMLLLGGERIFSRISTRKLIKLAKKAYSLKDDNEAYNKACKKLGKIIFKELNAQDNREPEYVLIPN